MHPLHPRVVAMHDVHRCDASGFAEGQDMQILHADP
jgi:hypothetical protein